MKLITRLAVFFFLISLTGCYTQLALDGYKKEKREIQAEDEYYDEVYDEDEYVEAEGDEYYDEGEYYDEYYGSYRPYYRRYYWGYRPGVSINFVSSPYYTSYWDWPGYDYYNWIGGGWTSYF